MSGDFRDFISLLDSGNQEAWDIMRFNMEQMIEHRCKEDLIEILWISDGTGIPKNKTQLFDEVFRLFREKFNDSLPQFENFKALKKYILDLCSSYINDGFRNFMLLLSRNDSRAWFRLDKDLKTKMVYWLVSVKKSNLTDAEQVYYDALITFTQVVQQKKLDFSSSKNLKSYIFRITELKMLEMNRENRRQEKFSNSETGENLSLVEELYDEELDLKIEELMKRLDTLEREILFNNFYHNKSLKTIASRLGITEENCRVIKFRALKKMKAMVKDVTPINAVK
ncbi:MAG: sigma-70 family RNA polymerase sigma factor [Bacteroidales bacterium]|nr:sigma-70 family RNA polymerase sigma factor [Bacteroidales bacterium]